MWIGMFLYGSGSSNRNVTDPDPALDRDHLINFLLVHFFLLYIITYCKMCPYLKKVYNKQNDFFSPKSEE